MRCKIDSKYLCFRIYKTGKGAWNTNNACLSCDIFKDSKQCIFTKDGEVKMSEFMSKLHEKAQDQPEMISLSDVPNALKVKITDAKMKTDTRGNECVYLYLRTTDAKAVVQKYPPSAFKPLEDAIQNAGGFEHLKATYNVWNKQIIARLKFDRLLPVPQAKEKKA